MAISIFSTVSKIPNLKPGKSRKAIKGKCEKISTSGKVLLTC